MALQKSIVTEQGFDATNAYHQVLAPTLITKTRMRFSLGIAKEKGLPFISQQGYECTFDLNGPNPLAQAYQFLKTLPEFSNATDC